MDEAFARLEDISVEQTLERLESLFEASGNFPQVNNAIKVEEHFFLIQPGVP